tara:strand:+ start:240 stop:536 length:297 start_codon:yes stop_codon:yes gene_type:complete
MGINRYSFTRKLNNGQHYGTWGGANRIYFGVESGTIPHNVVTLKEGVRLDQLAGSLYGDSSAWWVIAAASGIGWGLQVPPGTIIKMPTNIGIAIVVGR